MTKTKKNKHTAPRLPRMVDIKALPEAGDGLAWFVIGPNAWGKSKVAEKALANARYNGGPGYYTFHLVNEEAEVDTVNGTLWHSSTTEGRQLNVGYYYVRSY